MSSTDLNSIDPNRTDLIQHARVLVAKVLEVDPGEVADDLDFRDDLDADSLQMAEIAAVLEDELGLESDPDLPPRRFADVRDRLTARANP